MTIGISGSSDVKSLELCEVANGSCATTFDMQQMDLKSAPNRAIFRTTTAVTSPLSADSMLAIAKDKDNNEIARRTFRVRKL